MTLSLSSVRYSKTVHTIAMFTSGNILAMVLGVVGSLVQARYVGPEDMGIFRTFGIVAGYMTFLHLGVFDGLQREIPLQVGRGNQAKAEQAAAACLAWILFASLGCGSVFLGLAFRAALNREWMQFSGWLAHVPFIVATFYGGYLGTTFRTGQQFVKLSKANVIQSLAGTLVLPLLPLIGYFGVCLRTAVVSVTNLLFLHSWRPLRLRPHLDWRSFRGVIRIGLPLSGIGYLATSLWVSLEGTLVLKWFGIKTLGLYSVAIFIRIVVNQLALNMNQVMNVKIYEQYGRTGRVEDCLLLVIKPMLLAFLASLPLIIIGWFALPWVVNLLIPKYVGAISMMRVMLLTLPVTFLSLATTILWATGRRIDCFVSVFTGFVAFAVLSFLLFRLNVGVLSVLIASILGQAINVLASYLLLMKLAFQENGLLMIKK